MAVNKTELNRGIVFLAAALPLIFLGPAVIHFAFINKQQSLFVLVLIIGIAISGSGIFCAFKGLSKMVNSIFKP